MSEVYTLEQLRKMNQLDGNKELIFVEKVKEAIDKVKYDDSGKGDYLIHVKYLLEELGLD